MAGGLRGTLQLGCPREICLRVHSVYSYKHFLTMLCCYKDYNSFIQTNLSRSGNNRAGNAEASSRGYFRSRLDLSPSAVASWEDGTLKVPEGPLEFQSSARADRWVGVKSNNARNSMVAGDRVTVACLKVTLSMGFSAGVSWEHGGAILESAIWFRGGGFCYFFNIYLCMYVYGGCFVCMYICIAEEGISSHETTVIDNCEPPGGN